MSRLHNRRLLRFNLRFVLLSFTVCAVGMWVYWYGWPRWQWYVEQRAFIESATQVKAGTLISKGWRPVLKNYGPPWASDSHWHDEKGRFHRYFSCRWPNALFIVYWEFEDSYCSSVEVFRLPPPPIGYLPQTESSRQAVSRRPSRGRPPGMTPEKYREATNPTDLAYKLDFVQMIKGDRKDDMGFEYELIHCDRSPSNSE